MTQERTPVGEVGEAAVEAQPSAVVQRRQPGEEQAAEQLAEHAHRQKEGGAR